MTVILSSFQRAILEDEISLTPSVITVYATGYFPTYTNTTDVMEDNNNLSNLREDKIFLAANMADNLPFYKTNSEHDSTQKKDSLITMCSNDVSFSSLASHHKQTNNGVETIPIPSHQQQTIHGTNVSISALFTSSRVLSSDEGYTSNSILSSSNDGYISSNVSEYRQCYISPSLSESEYQQTSIITRPRLTSSSSELSFNAELQEEQEEVIKEGSTLNAPHGESCVHLRLPAMMSDSDADSGCKQVDLFSSPEMSMCQPFLSANALCKTASLNEVQSDWEKTAEEGIPSRPSRYMYTEDKYTTLLPGQQSNNTQVSLDSSGCLKDDPHLRLHHSCEEDMDVVGLFVDEQSIDRRVPLNSSAYLKDNLASPSSSRPDSGRDDLDLVCLPDGALDGMGSVAKLQTSVDLVTECEFDSFCHLTLAHSIQDDSDPIHTTMHSREDVDGYTHTLVQSRQDGDGYISSNLQLFPSVAESTRNLNEEDTF